MDLRKLNNFNNVNIHISFGNILFKILYMSYGPINSSIKQHSHSVNCYELHLITQGKGTLLIEDDRKFYAKPNSLFMTGPDILHEQVPDFSDPMIEYCICFEISKGKSFILNDEKQIYNEVCKLFIDTKFWFGEDTQNLLDIIQKLSDELEKKEFGYYINVKNLIGQIIISTVRNYMQHEETVSYVPVKSLDDKRLSIIDNFFLGINENSTLIDLAKQIGLSVRQTERVLKKFYNQSFNEKKLQAKLTAVANMLTTTPMSITQIADNADFSSIEHLYRTFKKYYQISPSEYRKKYK